MEPYQSPAPSATPDAGGCKDGCQRRDDTEVQWGEPTTAPSRWPGSLAVLAAILLQLVLPGRLQIGPVWLIPGLEAALGLVLLVASPRHSKQESRLLRATSIRLIALITLANVASLLYLVHALLYGSKAGGRQVVFASVPIWLTNVLVFGLWYWELDRGGPAARTRRDHPRPDFLFPQMNAPGTTRTRWSPRFSDYLYTSFTNSTAFSPTDTMPLTLWAKGLMSAQSLTSLLTGALVVSRAVNILN